jgi:hypothetical protein
MGARPGTGNAVTYLLSIVLLVAVAAAAVLIALQVQGDPPARFDVGPAEGIDCPGGVGTPACFVFRVTNLGNRPSGGRCEVSAPGGQRAAFLNDTTIYTSTAPFEPGVAVELPVKVDAGDDDIVTEPSLACTAV